jgi:hypothetical protein
MNQARVRTLLTSAALENTVLNAIICIIERKHRPGREKHVFQPETQRLPVFFWNDRTGVTHQTLSLKLEKMTRLTSFIKAIGSRGAQSCISGNRKNPILGFKHRSECPCQVSVTAKVRKS